MVATLCLGAAPALIAQEVKFPVLKASPAVQTYYLVPVQVEGADISWRKLPRRILQDQKDIWLFPLQLAHGHYWAPTLGIAGATAGLIAADPHVMPYFRTHAINIDDINDTFDGSITTAEIAIVPLSFLAEGYIRHNPYDVHTSLLAGEAYADGAIVDLALKEHLAQIPKPHLQEIGWTKAKELAKVARREGERFESATWLHAARSMKTEEFKRQVKRHLTGKETVPRDFLYFAVDHNQREVIEQALETAGLMLGTDKSRAYCLEMVCADFLAGARLEAGQENVWFLALARLISAVPVEQRRELLDVLAKGPETKA